MRVEHFDLHLQLGKRNDSLSEKKKKKKNLMTQNARYAHFS